jgi:hypothetical protein
MGFEFKSDQKIKPLTDSKTTLSTNESTNESTDDLTQIVYSEGEEGELAIRFIEENHLLDKFLLWQGIQEQLKKLKDSLDTSE